jgi:hypothetical protein
MKRIYVNVTDEQHDLLKARANRLGSTVSEEIRRAVAFGASTKDWNAVDWIGRQERSAVQEKAAE